MPSPEVKRSKRWSFLHPSFLHVMWSIIAAMFGVRSDKGFKEDLTSKSPWPYIAGGLIFAAVFVFLLVLAVHVVTM